MRRTLVNTISVSRRVRQRGQANSRSEKRFDARIRGTAAETARSRTRAAVFQSSVTFERACLHREHRIMGGADACATSRDSERRFVIGWPSTASHRDPVRIKLLNCQASSTIVITRADLSTFAPGITIRGAR